MKKNYDPLHIFDEMCLVNYYINYGTPKKEYEKLIKDVMGRDIAIGNENGKTSFYDNGDNQIIWIWTEKKAISLLAHECFHAVCCAMDKIKVSLTEDSEEIFAYQLQMLMRKILKKH